MIELNRCGDDLVVKWMEEWWVVHTISNQHIDLFQAYKMPPYTPLPAAAIGLISGRGHIDCHIKDPSQSKLYVLQDVMAAILKREFAFSDPTTKRGCLRPLDKMAGIPLILFPSNIPNMRIYCRLKSCGKVEDMVPKNA